MVVTEGLTDSRLFVVEGAAGAPICAAFGGGGGGMVKDRDPSLHTHKNEVDVFCFLVPEMEISH